MTKYDPWNNNINILNISLNRNTTFFILGPINKYNLRYELEIVIKKTTKQIYITMKNTNILSIEINRDNNTAYINYIGKVIKNGKEIYSGSDMVKLILKILKDLNINTVLLEDQSKDKCYKRLSNENMSENRLLPMLFIEDIPYGILTLLKNGKTFYMKFGFLPFNRGINISNDIDILYDNIIKISWPEIDNIIKKGKNTIDINNNILHKQDIPIFNVELWKKYWLIIEKSYNELYKKYGEHSFGPFDALKFYDNDNCRMFLNWLELYSISCKLFDKVNYKFYNKNGSIYKNVKIPFKTEFLDLIKKIRDVSWKIENLQDYNNIFTRLKKNKKNKNILIDINVLRYNNE